MFPWLNVPTASRLSDVRDISLAKLVRDDMLDQILSGTWRAGQRINEPDVAARLKVSRVPVREALRELESSGLVVSKKHSGVYVRELNAREIRDLYQLRGLLDGFAGRCAAEMPSDARGALLCQLDQSVTDMARAAQAEDLKTYYSENLRFHWLIVEAAGNHQVLETYRSIVQKLHLARLTNLAHGMGMQASIAEHQSIVAALRVADAAKCADLMTRHVGDAHARLTDAPTHEHQAKRVAQGEHP